MKQYTKKILSDGSVKIYEYEDNSDYYKKRISNKGYCKCDVCGSIVLNLKQIIDRHKQSKKCINFSNRVITNVFENQ
jgi:hypothetical protein